MSHQTQVISHEVYQLHFKHYLEQSWGKSHVRDKEHNLITVQEQVAKQQYTA